VRGVEEGRDDSRPSFRLTYCLTDTEEYAGPSVNWS
jgi:hypothetical protein